MKKRACVKAIFLFCLALFGCSAVTNASSTVGNSSDSSSASSSLATSSLSSGTVSSADTSSSGAKLTEEQIDRIIAHLMKVDGTGEIRMGQSKASVLDILHKNNIPTSDSCGALDVAGPTSSYIGYISAGRTTFFFFDYGLERVSLFETDKGLLRFYDTISRMKESYGNNYVYYRDPNGHNYFTYYLDYSKKITIEAQGVSDESLISNINLFYTDYGYTEKQLDEIDRSVAQLIKVDGTGKIWMGQKFDLTNVALNKHDVPYSGYIGVGRSEFYFSDNNLCLAYLWETDAGLVRYRDTVQKMKKIYGQYSMASMNQGGMYYFKYPLKNDKALFIEANGISDESFIYRITIAPSDKQIWN